MQIILVKITLYVTEKCQKPKFPPFYFLAKPRLSFEKCPKNQALSRPIPAASTALYNWPVIAVLKQCEDVMVTV